MMTPEVSVNQVCIKVCDMIKELQKILENKCPSIRFVSRSATPDLYKMKTKLDVSVNQVCIKVCDCNRDL